MPDMSKIVSVTPLIIVSIVSPTAPSITSFPDIFPSFLVSLSYVKPSVSASIPSLVFVVVVLPFSSVVVMVAFPVIVLSFWL